MPKSVLMLIACLAPFVSDSLVAQVPEAGFALVARDVQPIDAQTFRYSYELRNRGEDDEIFSRLLIDLRTPRDGEAPTAISTDGRFLFDALEEQPNPDFGHTPVTIHTPENWWSSIYFTGALSWSAERYLDGANHGVRAGETLRGFVLESQALPAYRPFRVIPYRPPRQYGAVEPIAPDSTWILREGYVAAPGVAPDQASGGYLLDQIDGACFFRSITDCDGYRGVARGVMLAEERGEDELYVTNLKRMADMLAADDALSEISQVVLGMTLGALERRLPSSR